MCVCLCVCVCVCVCPTQGEFQQCNIWHSVRVGTSVFKTLSYILDNTFPGNTGHTLPASVSHIHMNTDAHTHVCVCAYTHSWLLHDMTTCHSFLRHPKATLSSFHSSFLSVFLSPSLFTPHSLSINLSIPLYLAPLSLSLSCSSVQF